MNLYQPHLMRVDEIIDETPDTRTFRLSFRDPALREAFQFSAGQFGEYSVFGEGESTFCIASSPTRKGYIECSFRGIGKVTQAMRRLGVGDTLGFRGPYGNTFPIERMKGHSVVFVAGGIALPPVRCVIWNVLDLRSEFKDVTIIYGAKTVSDLVYKRELSEWASRPDVKLWQAVDPGGQTPDWKGEVGLIPKIVEGLLAHRTAGRWANTQENVFVLLALDRYFNTYEKVTPDFVARVWLGPQYAGEHQFPTQLGFLRGSGGWVATCRIVPGRVEPFRSPQSEAPAELVNGETLSEFDKPGVVIQDGTARPRIEDFRSTWWRFFPSAAPRPR